MMAVACGGAWLWRRAGQVVRFCVELCDDQEGASGKEEKCQPYETVVYVLCLLKHDHQGQEPAL